MQGSRTNPVCIFKSESTILRRQSRPDQSPSRHAGIASKFNRRGLLVSVGRATTDPPLRSCRWRYWNCFLFLPFWLCPWSLCFFSLVFLSVGFFDIIRHVRSVLPTSMDSPWKQRAPLAVEVEAQSSRKEYDDVNLARLGKRPVLKVRAV